jgi:hypothetical protein
LENIGSDNTDFRANILRGTPMMTRSVAILLIGIALVCGGLAYWGIGSSQGASFFGASEIPLLLGYAAAGFVALAVVASEVAKVRF